MRQFLVSAIVVCFHFQLYLAVKLEVRKAYRQLALKLHPDKQTKDCRNGSGQGQAFHKVLLPCATAILDRSCRSHGLGFRV